MAVESGPRRLAAVLAADIVGYTRLMADDEFGTHARFLRIRRELVEPTILEHRGRLVKNTGDGFLAMFDSPVEAVRCGIVIQQGMFGRNLGLPKHEWIQYRIGVNLGDVIVEPEDIYGDGVNIASRIEQLAEPGSVFVSGGVYEQIKYKLVCGYQSLGDKKVKNITEPVRIYRVLPDPGAVERAQWQGRLRRLVTAAAVVGLLCGAGGGWYVWQLYAADRSSQVADRSSQAADKPSQAADKPSQAADKSSQAVALPPDVAGSSSGPASRPADGSDREGTGFSAGAEAQVPAAPSPQLAAASPLRVEPPPPSQRTAPPVPSEPEMVAIAGGTFRMGGGEDNTERPAHAVVVAPFLIGRYPVTLREWKECVAAQSCASQAGGSGDDDGPATNLSWDDARQYVTWLAQRTGKPYRLPTEAEWEYAARGGTETKYWWGNAVAFGVADCRGCGEPYDARKPLRVGSRAPNPYGLYDMGGGVSQWVEDCWHRDYHGAPATSVAWTSSLCREHVLRGGSWKSDPSYLRTTSREYYDSGVRYPTHGLRVARSR